MRHWNLWGIMPDKRNCLVKELEICAELHWVFRKNIILILCKLIQKIEEGGYFLTDIKKPNSTQMPVIEKIITRKEKK